MSIYSKYFFSKKMNLIFIIFFISNLKCYICEDAQNSMSFKYPNCIELNNGNVLIIFSEGIFIYNSELSEELNHIDYESDFSLGENDLNLINLSIFDNGVVIAIIKTYLYLFSSTGEHLYHTTLNSEIQGASYYSLVPHKIDGNNYYYTISFIDSSYKLNIYYYYINISAQSNNQITSLQYSHTDSNYAIYSNKGLSCQLMSPLNEENVLTCFYEVTYNNFLAASSFILADTITQCSSVPIIYQSNGLPGNFKSAVTDGGTKALICYSPASDGANCMLYNIRENSFSKYDKYFNACNDNPNTMKVDFFAKTKEFIFTCFQGISLTIMKFDEDGNVIGDFTGSINSNYQIPGASVIFSYSILYLPIYPQYSLIITATRDDYCEHFLLPDHQILKKQPQKNLIQNHQILKKQPQKNLIQNHQILKKQPQKNLIQNHQILKKQTQKNLIQNHQILKKQPQKNLIQNHQILRLKVPKK